MNCKPGDLAIVINAFFCHENIGRIVEVVRRAVPGVDTTPDSTHDSWMVRSDRPLARSAGKGSFRIAPANEAPCADCNLRPVSGLPVDEEVKDELHA